MDLAGYEGEMSDTVDTIEELNISIDVGEYQVLGSGTIILPMPQSDIVFHIDDINIKISFTENTNLNEPELSYEKIDDKNLKIKCCNFGNADLGKGLVEPMEFMKSGDTAIYFKFIVTSLLRLPRILYTFYKRKG